MFSSSTYYVPARRARMTLLAGGRQTVADVAEEWPLAADLRHSFVSLPIHEGTAWPTSRARLVTPRR